MKMEYYRKEKIQNTSVTEGVCPGMDFRAASMLLPTISRAKAARRRGGAPGKYNCEINSPTQANKGLNKPPI
jgi:hypothetical protein